MVAVAPPEPPILSQGQIDIPQTFTVDLETGEVGGGDDLWFEADTATERFLSQAPGSDARFALMPGTRPPRYVGCRDAAVSSQRIPMSELSVGSYVCVHTNEGRVAQVQIVALPGPSPGTLTIRYVTWERE